ncbi:MAG TPA: Gfo/Idh/MocA family oxidoreductase [Planctomycetota bacterium]|nr:Gfo/Idh/MocA family oxidoreductase [Planctomycetota bacterium]
MPTNIGIIGCGNIAPAYFNTLRHFSEVKLAACADMDVARAQARAKEFGVAKACSVDELLADPAIEIVINLTIPKAHVAVGLQIVAAGKHPYSEKPLGLDRAEGKKLLDAAKAKGVRVGSAPDTVLGPGTQTCRKLIDDGAIGTVVGGTAFMLCSGHESWHPDPAFYYQKGGGPMFDMGPYYLTSLITLLGPVKRVTGVTRTTHAERLITSAPKKGTKITVDVPTHVAGILEFASGAIVTLTTSFDVPSHTMPNIELWGTAGGLSVPDPNGFAGTVRLRKREEQDWKDVPLNNVQPHQERGMGVLDMAAAIREKRAHRASGELAYHVLDIMQALHESSASGQFVTLTSTCAKPEAMKAGAAQGAL